MNHDKDDQTWIVGPCFGLCAIPLVMILIFSSSLQSEYSEFIGLEYTMLIAAFALIIIPLVQRRQQKNGVTDTLDTGLPSVDDFELRCPWCGSKAPRKLSEVVSKMGNKERYCSTECFGAAEWWKFLLLSPFLLIVSSITFVVYWPDVGPCLLSSLLFIGGLCILYVIIIGHKAKMKKDLYLHSE